MNKLPLSIAAAAVLLAHPALAATAAEGWYAGLSNDATHLEVWRGLGWEQGGEEGGWSLRGGYRVGRHFALEGTVLHAGDLEWTEYFANIGPGYITAESRFDVEALELTAAGVVPFGSIWEFHGKGGLAWSRLSGQQLLGDLWDNRVSRSFRDSGTGYVLGVSIGANVTDRWNVRFDYQFFATDRDGLGISGGDDPTVDTLSVGVHYRFGRVER